MDYQVILRFALAVMIGLPYPDSARCQEQNTAFMEAAEEILALSDEADLTSLLEDLAGLRELPVNVNSGDEKEIARLFFLTEFQVLVLADHVRKNGNVQTIYELALLPAFDRSTVMMMVPYISLKPSVENAGRIYGRTQMTVTATTRFGASEDGNDGIRSLLKLKHDQGRFSFGITAENDPGEKFTFKKTPGFDFLSGYLDLGGRGIVKSVILGDYKLRLGEGLAFNSIQWIGSGLSAPSFISGRSSASIYTSTEENNFFRGISLVLGNRNYSAVVFSSLNRLDARLVFNEDSLATGVSNLVKGGLHTTESQLNARNSLTEAVTGLHLTAGSEKVRGGLTSAATFFSLPFIPDKTRPENLHDFEGDRLLNLAADFRAGTGPLLLFAETGLSIPGSWAAIAGLRAKPSARVTFNLLARCFSPDYHAFHYGAYKAGSGSGNETGLAASLHLEAARHLFITAGVDQYRIPAPRYRSAAPSYGSRIEIKGEFLPRDDLSLRLSYTSSAREYDIPSETGMASSVTHIRHQAGFVFDFEPATGFRLTTRISGSFIFPSQEKGYLLCQDLTHSFDRIPLRIWFRYALCSTGGWDSRLYAWENDLLSSFSVPALYSEMTRSFIMLSWKPTGTLEARLKYSFTDSEKGLRQEVKCQMRINFLGNRQ
ncbi:MAG: hypothetical protein AB9888_15795 [Bacteroidales bacterium]